MDIPFQVKLLDIPLQIIERYRPFQENNLMFPKLNYWSICKPLKKIIRECVVNKEISFHVGRHSYATALLTSDIPLPVIKEMLGHSDIKVTQIYAKVVDSKKDEVVNCLNRLYHG